MATVSLKHIGLRLARLRKRAGLTQADAAEKLGVTNETISRLERGVQWTDFKTLQGLARLYNVELSDLMAVFPDDPDGHRLATIGEVVDLLKKQTLTDVQLARDVLKVLFRRGQLGRNHDE